jgi:hypothetical protein
MGYALLWASSLATSLLFVAVLLACIGRLQRRWLRHVLWCLVALGPLALYATITGFAIYCVFYENFGVPWAGAMVTTILFAIGALVLCQRGLRASGEPSGPSMAGTWPRGKLAVGFLVALALHLLTVGELDLAAKHQLAELRAEAGTLALSVAPAPVANRNNAALVYDQAFELLGPDGSWPKAWNEKWQRWAMPKQPDFDPKDAELREFLKQQASALALLHQAVERADCNFGHNYGRLSVGMLLPELSAIRSSTSLLMLEAKVKLADGEIRSALKNVNTMFAMAEHVVLEPIVVSLLVGASIDNMAVVELEEVLASGIASADDLATVTIDGTLSYRRSMERTFRTEEAVQLMMFYELGHQGSWGLVELKPSESYAPLSTSLYRIFMLPSDLEGHRRFSDSIRSLAAKPYHLSQDGFGESYATFHDYPSGIITQLLTPMLGLIVQEAAKADARRRVARLGLASYRYRAEHGNFPEKLTDLVPEFLLFIPQDPFDGKPLKFKPTEAGLVIYSIGPDMKDDDGAPYNKKLRTGDIAFSCRLREGQ